MLDMTPTYTILGLVSDVLASIGNPMSVDEVFDHAVDTGLDQRLSGTVNGLTKASLNTCMNGMARGDAATLRKTSTKPTRCDFVDGAAPTMDADATTDDGVPGTSATCIPCSPRSWISTVISDVARRLFTMRSRSRASTAQTAGHTPTLSASTTRSTTTRERRSA